MADAPLAMPEPTGVVVGILRRPQMDYVACLALDEEAEIKASMQDNPSLPLTPATRYQRLLCVPMDRRIPKIRLRSRQVREKRNVKSTIF